MRIPRRRNTWRLTRPAIRNARLRSNRSFGALVHPNQSGAAAASPPAIAVPPLATMLTRHILQDGEIVLLTAKPSLWFIPFTSLRFIAIVLILMIAARLLDEAIPYHTRTYMEAGVIVLAGRLMWAIMQWMSRLYILTDCRILALSGVFQANIFDCPLRKVARVRIVQSLRERPLNIGSIEIIPIDDTQPVGIWQTIARPREAHRVISSTLSRARQGVCGD
jgi:hypothetical protein